MMGVLQSAFDEFSDDERIPQWIRSTVLVASAILFQGTVYMDRTERAVKLGLTLAGGAFFSRTLPVSDHRVLKSFALAHFLNFLFNGHPWVAGRGFELVHTPPSKFESWIDRLERVGEASDSIAAVAVYGSRVRGEWDATSDLDVRVIRYPGARNGLLASLLVARERSRATLARFPLDVYVLDGTESLSRLRDDERPNVLVDKENWLEAPP